MDPQLRAIVIEHVNVGPLGTVEGLYESMQLAVDAMDETVAPRLLDLLVEIERAEDEPVFATAMEIADRYAKRFPEAVVEAAWTRLTRDGPACLLDVLGSTKDRSLVAWLLATIDASRTSVEVAIALVDCLGELGGPTAANALRELRGRAGLAPELLAELDAMLPWIDEGAVDQGSTSSDTR